MDLEFGRRILNAKPSPSGSGSKPAHLEFSICSRHTGSLVSAGSLGFEGLKCRRWWVVNALEIDFLVSEVLGCQTTSKPGVEVRGMEEWA